MHKLEQVSRGTLFLPTRFPKGAILVTTPQQRIILLQFVDCELQHARRTTGSSNEPAVVLPTSKSDRRQCW